MSEIADPLEELSQATVTLDPIRYYNTLNSFPGDIWDMLSTESNNSDFYLVFHEIALSVIREQKLLEFLDQAVLFVNIIQIKNKYPDNYAEVFKRLLNHKDNDEGRTPLHIAIMAGRRVNHIQNLTYCYLKLGADCTIVDSKGKGVIHLAASAGQLALIARFHKEFKIPLDIKDNDGRTALHTAAFEGQEQSSTALIAWSQDMNEQDNEGNTPLHLSTLAKSYRIIRHLLMRGASREIRNNEGFTALNLAEQHGASIQIREALSSQSWFANFNPIGTPLKPVANSYAAFCVFLFVFVGRWASIFLFVIPHLEFWFGVAFCVSFVANFILFQIASNTNPGYAERDPKMNIFRLYETYNGDFVCAYCEVRRSYQIKHCQHCNRCVKKFDHHCPWIHNCVGKKYSLFSNHFSFFLFLLVIETDFLYTFIIGILDELEIVQGDGLYHEIFENEPWHSCGETVSFIVGIISGVLFLLVLPLFYVQLVNVIKNTTTHQRFAYNVLFKQKTKDVKGRESRVSADSDTSSMLLANEDNEITHLTGRLSPISDSEVSVQETTTKCFCFKKKSIVDWQKLNEEESNKG